MIPAVTKLIIKLEQLQYLRQKWIVFCSHCEAIALRWSAETYLSLKKGCQTLYTLG